MDIIEEIYSDIKLLLVEIRDVNTTYNNELYKDIEEIDELISNKYNIDKESFNGIIESSFYTLFSYEKIISYIDSIIEKINRSKIRAKNEISRVLFDICIKDCAWLNFAPALALFSEN